MGLNQDGPDYESDALPIEIAARIDEGFLSATIAYCALGIPTTIGGSPPDTEAQPMPGFIEATPDVCEAFLSDYSYSSIG